MNFLGKKRWFTLIEMLIVIVIIGVLASALIPRLGSARGKANDVARKADLQQVATAIISYQIDQNKFPVGPKTFTDTGFQADLKKGGIASIPVGDTTTIWSGMKANESTSGYMYYPMYKNGWNNNWFILVSRAETEWWSNFVLCGNTIAWDWSDDVEDLEICSSVTFDPDATNCWVCAANDKWQLRYVYKY